MELKTNGSTITLAFIAKLFFWLILSGYFGGKFITKFDELSRQNKAVLASQERLSTEQTIIRRELQTLNTHLENHVAMDDERTKRLRADEEKTETDLKEIERRMLELERSFKWQTPK